MSKITMVGCDLHSRSMVLQVATGLDEPVEKRYVNDREGRQKMAEYLISFARKAGSKRIIVGYEASGEGFGLYDTLGDAGIEAVVLSPTHLPQSRKRKKNKTDAKDARMILDHLRGHFLGGAELADCWVPPQRLRDDRELVRARLEAAEASSSVKLQVLSLLKRRGVELPEWFQDNRNYTKRFFCWLQGVAQDCPREISIVLSTFIERLQLLERQVGELTKQVKQLSKADRYRDAAAELQKLIGVGLITTMTFLTELGDLTRFGNRRQLASYLGLCPSSFESGEVDDRKGHITRQGPSRLRKVLCQAAWSAVRNDEHTAADWRRICGKKKQQGKKAIVAIMRKLGIKLWRIALQYGVDHTLMSPPRPEPHWLQRPGNQATAV